MDNCNSYCEQKIACRHGKVSLKTCIEIIKAVQYFRTYAPVRNMFDCSSAVINCVLSNQDRLINAHRERQAISSQINNSKDAKNTNSTFGKDFNDFSVNVDDGNLNDPIRVHLNLKNESDSLDAAPTNYLNDDMPYTIDLISCVSVIRTFDFNTKKNCKDFNETKLANMFKCSRQEVELILLNRDSLLKEFQDLPPYSPFKWREKKKKLAKNLVLQSNVYKNGNSPECIRAMVQEDNVKEKSVIKELQELELAEAFRINNMEMNLSVDSVIGSYAHALTELKHVEEYAMLSENYSAISLLIQLQDHIQKQLTTT